ncbi:hypothetical protein EMPS_01470 [Entomortierella parvispora]|uniref:Carboxylesterase type B domain-containing protein n=1 Tax=Entomortierella parvispora TaxID=205924 RepID=A0A9P3H306_9FUNG|nr:hypothetical protein EMPS_01470 [Entomortierella parvispora]
MIVRTASLSTAISLTFLAASVSLPTSTSAATLVENPPSANSLGGAHILLENDLDSNTARYPVIFLSKPLSYNNSRAACATLGEDLVQSSGYGNLTRILSNTPVAQNEVKGSRRFWVANKGNDASHCTAFDRRDGSTVQLSCMAKLPSLCKNSVARTMFGATNDKSKQITVTPPEGLALIKAPKRWTLANKNSSSSVVDATEFGHPCIQRPFAGSGPSTEQEDIMLLGGTQSEDCLFLNVFTPTLNINQAGGLPVMVFIHGGAYTTFSGTMPIYEPGNVVSRGGVVVVTLNYRLSIFGLFENTPAISRSKAPGNLATRDHIAALLWVRENIAAFGGNPSKVTIFGESAGAVSLRALISAPSAFGLYNNVISMSDPMGIPFSSSKVASGNLGAGTMKALGCQASDLACAQKKTVDEIQQAQTQAINDTLAKNIWIPNIAVFRPNADGEFIPADFADLVRTGRYNKKANILFGTNRNEYDLFTPAYYPDPIPLTANATLGPVKMFHEANWTRKLFENSPYYRFSGSEDDTVRRVWSQVATDSNFGCAVQMMTRAVSTSNGGGDGKVYLYRNDHGRSQNAAMGDPVLPFCVGQVCHSDDLVPTFASGDVFAFPGQTGDDARYARQVVDRFSTFARTGDPNPAKGAAGAASSNEDLKVQWPVFETASSPVFHFDVTNSSVIDNADKGKCNWIAQNVQYYYQIHSPSGKVVPIYPSIEKAAIFNAWFYLISHRFKANMCTLVRKPDERPSLSTAILLAFLVASVSLPTSTSAATLVQNPPSANSLGGAHILLENDLDSKTTRYPIIFLSKPLSYNNSRAACATLGEDLVQSSGYGNLTRILSNTPVAQNEVKGSRRFWVANKGNDASHCTAFDRRDGSTVQLSCMAKLPSLCKNSVARTMIGATNDKSKQITVTTGKVGTYQGYRDQNAFRFLGIPYAQVPVGSLRFAAPKQWTLANHKNSSSSVVDATEFGHPCIQLPFAGLPPITEQEEIYELGGTPSEDCLVLNVFTPTLKANQTKGLPVMVFIHGGSFTSYSGTMPIYEPGNVVSRGGVVVVTLNYRLSIFGLFENTPAISRSQAPGNLAIRDQIAALLWVRENIAAFGGNPSKVTIFGESAGAVSLRALISAPSAFGLYNNVISMSDPMGIPFSSSKVASGNLGAGTMKALGCQASDLACAQKKTVDEIQQAQTQAINDTLAKNIWIPNIAVFRPNADGEFIPADFADLVRTGRYNKKANILFGTNRNEYDLFTPAYYPDPIPLTANATLGPVKMFPEANWTRKLFENSPYYRFNGSKKDTVRRVWSQAATDSNFGCAVQMMTRAVSTSSGNGDGKVYLYRNDHGRSCFVVMGAPAMPFCVGQVCHTDDLVPTFASGDAFAAAGQTGDDARYARQVVDRFSTFARTGNPNPAKGAAGAASSNEDLKVQWPVFETASSPVFHFDVTNSSVIDNADKGKCNWIAQNVQYYYQIHSPNGKFVPIYPPIA